jgi:glycosyl transferase, family 25
MQNFSAILINMDRDTERLEHTKKQLAQANIAFKRQAGVFGDDVPSDLRHFFFDESGRPKTTMKRGEIGCYASHLRVLKQIASGELGPAVLVMEDDIDIVPDLTEIIAETLLKLPAGWDILRLACSPRRAYTPVARVGAARFLVSYSKIPNSMCANLITPEGARKFLEKGVRGLTIDDDLRRPWFHSMKTFGLVPPPVKPGELNLKSAIDSLEAGRFDKGVSSRMERILRGDHYYMFKRLAYNVRDLGMKNWLVCTAINLADMIVKPILGRSIIHMSAKVFSIGM